MVSGWSAADLAVPLVAVRLPHSYTAQRSCCSALASLVDLLHCACGWAPTSSPDSPDDLLPLPPPPPPLLPPPLSPPPPSPHPSPALPSLPCLLSHSHDMLSFTFPCAAAQLSTPVPYQSSLHPPSPTMHTHTPSQHSLWDAGLGREGSARHRGGASSAVFGQCLQWECHYLPPISAPWSLSLGGASFLISTCHWRSGRREGGREGRGTL